MSDNEAAIYRVLTVAAEAGHPCPSNAQLAERLGCDSLAFAPKVIAKLERYGLIQVERWQRTRRVTIVRTGKATAEPAEKSPHWRTRTDLVPTPARDSIASSKPDIVDQMAVAANLEGRMFADFLADLVWMGWKSYQQDRGLI